MTHIIADKMKDIRRRLNLTQVQIAHLAGTSNSYVAHLEKGKMMPSLEFAFKIEKALKITTGDISNLVIESIRKTAGLSGGAPQAQNSLAPAFSATPGIESVALRQDCPSCGEKISLKVAFSATL